MTSERLEKLKAVLNRRQPDLTVLMDNVHKTHNLAALTRTCDAVGIPEVHAITNQLRQELKRNVAKGTQKWVKVTTHKTIPLAYEHLRKRGFTVLCAHACEAAVDFRDIDYRLPAAIVVGAELRGPSDDAVRLADKQIFLPMLGMARSFNVSVAASIILYHALEQRQQAGMYNQRRIDDKMFRTLLFEWVHPEISAYCRKHKLSYPKMDEDGNIDPGFNEIRGQIQSDSDETKKEIFGLD